MRDWLQAVWYRESSPPWPLRLLARLYGRISAADLRRRKRRQRRLPVPVVVVGNLSVGGTGKTPTVLWLLQALRGMGHRPGVISRGYGGRGPFPSLVDPESDPRLCGDEPLLIAQRSGVPVAVAPDRAAAGRALLDVHPEIDVIVADDGLQHLQLARDLEVCVVDGVRGFGNGFVLPAGPLREPLGRLQSVDLLLVNGGDLRGLAAPALRFDLVPGKIVSVRGAQARLLDSMAGQRVHAVAGIGNPGRFFDLLRRRGLDVVEHPFADHHDYSAADLAFAEVLPLLMTEKDAVKCRGLGLRDAWMVPVDACFSDSDAGQLQARLQRLFAGNGQTSGGMV